MVKGGLFQDYLGPEFLWWLSMSTVNPCLSYVNIACIDGKPNASDYGEALSNVQDE